MEALIKHLLHAPIPMEGGCLGACLNTPDADEWRVSDAERYAEWLLALPQDASGKATLSGAWRRGCERTTIVYSTGLAVERVHVLVRRAIESLTTKHTPDDALLARTDIMQAAREMVACGVRDEVENTMPEYAPVELSKLATFALCVAHARYISTIASNTIKAGLWLSLTDLALSSRDPAPEAHAQRTVAETSLEAIRWWAESHALQESAANHFSNGKLSKACACARRAAEMASKLYCDDPHLISKDRVDTLRSQSTSYDLVLKTCGSERTQSRVFDSADLVEAIKLPVME